MRWWLRESSSRLTLPLHFEGICGLFVELNSVLPLLCAATEETEASTRSLCCLVGFLEEGSWVRHGEDVLVSWRVERIVCGG